MRLSGSRAFARVYQAKARAASGPLLVYARPNDCNHPRLGLAVPRAVGTAVKRNLIKRRLREAFRLMQRDWPVENSGYDLVINVRPHDSLRLSEYEAALRLAIISLQRTWTRRQTKPQGE